MHGSGTFLEGAWTLARHNESERNWFERACRMVGQGQLTAQPGGLELEQVQQVPAAVGGANQDLVQISGGDHGDRLWRVRVQPCSINIVSGSDTHSFKLLLNS